MSDSHEAPHTRAETTDVAQGGIQTRNDKITSSLRPFSCLPTTIAKLRLTSNQQLPRLSPTHAYSTCIVWRYGRACASFSKRHGQKQSATRGCARQPLPKKAHGSNKIRGLAALRPPSPTGVYESLLFNMKSKDTPRHRSQDHAISQGVSGLAAVPWQKSQ